MEEKPVSRSSQLIHRRTLRPALVPFALLAAASSAVAQLLPQEQALFLHYTPGASTPGPNVSDLVSADLDGDGDLDLVIADATANRVRLLFNLGAAGFSPATLSPGVAPSALA